MNVASRHTDYIRINCFKYLHDTVRVIVKHKAPNELIFNFKLKSSKYRISPNKRHASNKRSIASHSD